MALSTFGIMFAPDQPRAAAELTRVVRGTRTALDEWFGPHAAAIHAEVRPYVFRYASAEHWVDEFRRFYGPTHRAFATLDENRRRGLHEALIELLRRHDRGAGAGLVVPADYLEVVVRRL